MTGLSSLLTRTGYYMIGNMVDKKLEIKKKSEIDDGMNYIKPSISKTNNPNKSSKKQGINMKLVCYVAIFIVLFSSLGSCFDNVVVVESERELYAMDTYMTFKVYGRDREKALNEIVRRVQELDDIFSVGKDDSQISKLNKKHALVNQKEVSDVISKSLEVSKATDGAFDITVFPLMKEWGFTTEDYKVVDDDRLSEILKSVDFKNVTVDDEDITLSGNTEVDLGGIVKGYTGDVIADILSKYNVKAAVVSLGGNIEVYKKKAEGKPWKIAIDNPDKDKDKDAEPVGYIEIDDAGSGKAIVTSGDYERYFEKDGVKYHHILDPKTGKSVKNGVRSVTIVSDDGILADALSTALFVMGKDKAKEYWKKHSDEFDYAMIMEDKKIIVSDGLKDDFTTDFECEYVK